jgi:2'-5' RNA ligase
LSDGSRAETSSSDERVRLFVALALPEPVRDELVRWRGEALRDVRGLRLLAPEALHVTLCFLGWRWEGEVSGIAEACESVANIPAMPLALGESLWLPARRPRVLAVEVGDPTGELGRVHAKLSAALSGGGWYRPEARPFLAHVTVARARGDARVKRTELVAPESPSFDGSLITLYRSRLGGGGARYEPLRRVELGSVTGPTDPVAIVERFHVFQARAYAKGEMEPLREHLRDDVVWHVPGGSAIAGEHRGIEEVLAYFARRRAMTDATFRVTIHGVGMIGDRVMQLAGGSAVRDGRGVSWETVGVFRVAGGQIAECWLLPFDLPAFDEIWG